MPLLIAYIKNVHKNYLYETGKKVKEKKQAIAIAISEAKKIK